MASSTVIVNSTLLKIYAGAAADPSTVIANCTDASISITHDLRDITTKDSAGFRELTRVYAPTLSQHRHFTKQMQQTIFRACMIRT